METTQIQLLTQTFEGHAVADHFADVGKMVDLGSGSQTMLTRGIRPEALPPAEDVKKVQRRLTSDEKKALKNPDTLDAP